MVLAPDDRQEDTCGQCLLIIVARGTAIITELYRLVELIPEPFLERQAHLDQAKRLTLNQIVFNFSYFKEAEQLEAKIEANAELKRADEQFCDQHVDLLTRFYLTFEAVQRHANDLNRFIVDLENEVYLGQTLDTLLVHTDNRQLLCEAYFQLGHMLLLVDRSFEGDLRERLIVSYYRYSAYKSLPGTNLDDTCNLMRATGYRCQQQKFYGASGRPGETATHRPANYPESYFDRAGVNQLVVSTLIAKLQTVDVYNKTVGIFPHSDHRSSALAQQASILYVILYFCPNLLRAQRSRMREITDKFFSDNWVVHVFMGELVNLLEAWDPYKAARESLTQIYDADCVRSLATQFSVRFNRNFKQLDGYLRDGWLTEDSFIEHSSRILNCLRDSNVVLKWLLLHSHMQPSWQSVRLTRTLRAVVLEVQPEAKKLCGFLQNLCVLEKRTLNLSGAVLAKRHSKVAEFKLKACDMLDELVGIFNDSKPMRWVKAGANLSLAKILEEARANLATLDHKHKEEARSRDSIIKLVNRIETARDSYLDGKSLQVVQLFDDTKESLVRMLRYLDMADDLQIILHAVGDFSYGWRLMDQVFTSQLQLVIKEDPRNLLAFEAIVIKLTSAFEPQLMRIQQLEAKTDLISVSQYYSRKLVGYIQNVLQIIPATILDLISAIIQLDQAKEAQARQLPSKILPDQLKDYAQPEQRFQTLQLTCKISHYAKGMMSMPNTPIGLIRIDLRQMLESGIRRELRRQMTDTIQSTLKFGGSNHGPTRSQFGLRSSASSPLSGRPILDKLNELSSTLNSYKKSFEYIQDFLSIYGLKMWQEELGSIVRSGVDQAISSLMSDSRNVQLLRHNQNNNPSSELGTKSLAGLSIYASKISAKHETVRTKEAKLGAITTSSLAEPGTSSNSEANFMVRLLDELLKLTNPRETIYYEQSSVWFDRRQARPGQRRLVLDATRTLKLVGSSLGVAGLNGLDKLCSCLLMIELESLADLLAAPANNKSRERSPPMMSMLDAMSLVHGCQLELGLAKSTSAKHSLLALFSAALGAGLAPNATEGRLLIDHLLSVGQLQIIRLNIQCVLSTGCRFEARHLYGCLEALNATLLATLRQGRGSPSPTQQKRPGDESSWSCCNISLKRDENSSSLIGESQLVFELANYLDWVGCSEPTSKIYTLALQRAGNSEMSPSGVDNQKRAVYQVLEQAAKCHGGGGSSTGDRQHSASRSYAAQAATEQALHTADGQPLYLGIQTLLNHFQTSLVV